MKILKKNIFVLLSFSMLVFLSPTALALPNTDTKFENPINATDAQTLTNTILNNLRGVLVGIALVFIVIGAIMYIMSAGEEKKMTAAKSTITAAMIGLAIALAAPSFLSEIIRILGGTGSNSGVTSPGGITIQKIIENVLNFLLSIVGILSLIGLVLGGGTYMTAYGDEKKIESGKNMIKSSIIGIVVALGAMVIVNQLAQFFQ